MRRFLLLAVLASACADTTGGGLVSAPFVVGGLDRPDAGPLTFTTAAGWTVTLEHARIALGPFYFNLSPPPTHAFRAGVVVVEATEQRVVDPLDATLFPLTTPADGETGHAVAAEIGLLPPDATASADALEFLHQDVGRVVGTAVKAGVTISFDGPIAIDRSLATAQTPLAALQRINGAGCDLRFTEAPQTVTLRVDPRPWFEQVEFGSLSAGPQVGGRFTWDSHTTFGSQLLQGVQSVQGVYRFSIGAR